MSQDPDFYNKVHLMDYTIEQAIDIVKGMTMPELAKYITEEIVKPVWENQKKRTWRLATLKTFFNNRAKERKDIESMESWVGVLVGGRDIRSRTIGIDDVSGQNYLLVTDSGEVRGVSGYGKKIGPSGSEMFPPMLSRVGIRVLPKKVKDRTYWNGKFIYDSVPIPLSELKKYLNEKAILVSDLTDDMKYQDVLLRAQIGAVTPVENWIDSDEPEPVKDKDGNIEYQRDEKDPSKIKIDADGKPVPKWRFKRVTDGIGQNLLQAKADRSNTVQYVFKLTLYEDEVKKTRATIRFQRTRLADHFILMPDVDIVMQDAGSMPIGGSEDGFTSLSSMWGNKEVLVAGTITGIHKSNETTWYTIDGVFVLDNTDNVPLELPSVGETHEAPAITPVDVVPVAPVSPVVPAVPVTPAAPVAPAPPPVVEVAPAPAPAIAAKVVDTLAISPTPTPVVEAVPVAPVAPSPAPTPVTDPFAQLKKGIKTIFGSIGDNITYEMLMAMKDQIPVQFHTKEQKPVVEAFMESTRIDMMDAAPPAETAPPVVTATTETVTLDVLTPEQLPEPTKEVAVDDHTLEAHPAVATISPEQILAKTAQPKTIISKEEMIPCRKCGKMLSPSEVMTHHCGDTA